MNKLIFLRATDYDNRIEWVFTFHVDQGRVKYLGYAVSAPGYSELLASLVAKAAHIPEVERGNDYCSLCGFVVKVLANDFFPELVERVTRHLDNVEDFYHEFLSAFLSEADWFMHDAKGYDTKERLRVLISATSSRLKQDSEGTDG